MGRPADNRADPLRHKKGKFSHVLSTLYQTACPFCDRQKVMAWIESHQAVLGHPKTRRLCRSLEVKPVTAIGHLHALWWWALDYAQDGSLGGYESADIADAALWEGDPDEFYEALVASGYVDRDENGTRLHDWWEYAGKLIQRRKDDAERKRKQAEKAGIPTGNGTPSNGFPAELQRNSNGCLQESSGSPYVTNQPTNPYQPTVVGDLVPDIPRPRRRRKQNVYDAAADDVRQYVDEILEIEPWDRFREKGNTLDLVTQMVLDKPTADLVHEAKKCVSYCRGINRAIKSITALLNWVDGAKNLRQKWQTPVLPSGCSPIFSPDLIPDVLRAFKIVSQQVSTDEYNQYLGGVTTSQPNGNTVFISCADPRKRERLQTRFMPMIVSALMEIHSPLRPELAS